MYRKVLVAYNGTPGSRCALREVVRIVSDASVEVHLAGVVSHPAEFLAGGQDGGPGVVFSGESARKEMEEHLREGRKFLIDQGLNITDHLLIGEPVDVVSELVSKLGIDLLIVGYPRGTPVVLRWWRGSVGKWLIERIPCSILVAGSA